MSKRSKKKIILFSHADCVPCQDIRKLIEKGEVDAGDAEELEIVDVDTDEGFNRFEKEVLSKLPDDGEAQLPGAYLAGMVCQIKMVDDDKFVIFDCPQKEPPKKTAEATPQ